MKAVLSFTVGLVALAFLSGCGGGGSSSSATSQSVTRIAGTWAGTWSDRNGSGDHGTITLTGTGGDGFTGTLVYTTPGIVASNVQIAGTFYDGSHASVKSTYKTGDTSQGTMAFNTESATHVSAFFTQTTEPINGLDNNIFLDVTQQ